MTTHTLNRNPLKTAAITLGLALCAAAGSAAACPVVYVFTGSTDYVSGASIPAGTPVTGTYTFDYDNTTAGGNAASSLTFGQFGSGTTGWAIGNATLNSSPADPLGYAFSTTVQVGGFTYASPPTDPQSKQFYSSWGNQYDEQNYTVFDAFEAQSDRYNNYTSSELYLANADYTKPAFGPHGMPQVSPGAEVYGVVETNTVYIGFYISSLTPVVGPGHCTFGGTANAH